MNTWLHFIGRAYYTRQQFAREAKAIGITRRIARNVARRFEYGDVVYLAAIEGASAVLFGKFVVRTLSGLSSDELAALEAECGGFKCVEIGGDRIVRECGAYVAGPVLVPQKPVALSRIVELAAAAEGEHGKLMLGGELIELEPVRLKSVKRSHQGFRPFDADAFAAAVAAAPARSRGMRTVPGFFYVGADAEPSSVVYLDERRLQTVYGYARAERPR